MDMRFSPSVGFGITKEKSCQTKMAEYAARVNFPAALHAARGCAAGAAQAEI
ncbi:hypothetical protein [Paracoccus jeotgali]|uniref:hypothetical protein n=1 Tax=Paracoccus jeotgali TaxID=2065379 RepID=UPI0013152DCF|nr:hypothetical protein [Paracoccus jeotgali]